MKLFARLAAAVSLLLSACANTPSSPAGGEAFAPRAVARIKSADPRASVSIVDPHTLAVIPGGTAGSIQVNLERFENACRQAPNTCDQTVDQLVAAIPNVAHTVEPVPAAALRAVVRPATYGAQTTGSQADTTSRPIMQPFAPGLAVFCVIDFPDMIRFATTADIGRLGLSAQEAMAVARRNTAAALGAPRPRTKPSSPITVLAGDPYESSRILNSEEWAQVGSRFAGGMLAAIPASDILLFGPGNTQGDVQAMSDLAVSGYRASVHPITPQLFRWNGVGWQPAKP